VPHVSSSSLLTVSQACFALRDHGVVIPYASLYRRALNAVIPAQQVAGKVLIDAADLPQIADILRTYDPRSRAKSPSSAA
jgi:hypothetical protein